MTRAESSAATAVSALRAALAAENSAVYAYGVAGAHLAGSRRAAAVRDWVAHQAARDALTSMLASSGGQPVASAAAYALPFGVHNDAAAAALAALIEDRVTSVYLGLVGLAEPRLRAFGAAAMRTAALRAAYWRGSTLAFPGLQVPAAIPPRGATGPGATPPAPHTSPTPSHPG